MEEEIVETTTQTPEEETPEVETPEEPKEETPSESDIAQAKELEEKNKQLFERAKKAEAEAKALKIQSEKQKASKQTLDVEDYIDISASLEGLDQREKEYLAKQHKLTGQSLSEIRKSEDFVFWQTAYKDKVEKDKTLNPSTKQTLTERKTFEEKLQDASLDEKEEMLIKAGLWKNPKQNNPKERNVLYSG